MLHYYWPDNCRLGKTDPFCHGGVSPWHALFSSDLFTCRTLSGYHMATLGENVRAVLQGFEEWRREKGNV